VIKGEREYSAGVGDQREERVLSIQCQMPPRSIYSDVP